MQSTTSLAAALQLYETEFLAARNLAFRSRREYLASIRSFFSFLQETGILQVSPALKLIPPARERLQPRVLSEAEYKRLLEVVRGDIRDQAIIELLLQTGLRLSEVARLHVNHVSLPTKISKEPGYVGSVTVLGKGRK